MDYRYKDWWYVIVRKILIIYRYSKVLYFAQNGKLQAIKFRFIYKIIEISVLYQYEIKIHDTAFLYISSQEYALPINCQ